MVMKQNRMRKNLTQSIRRSLGRYIAIVAIIALGCSIFVGLRVTKTDMVATGQKYTDEQNMFDLRLLSTYGWTREDVAAIAEMNGIIDAEGAVILDVFLRYGDDGEDAVYRLYSIPESVNQVFLLGGRMPETENECLVDGAFADDSMLGTKITISDANGAETLESLNCHTYTVVGYVSTPLYMDMSRGTTTLGSGTLTSYLYIPQEAFEVDYFTEIYVTIPGDWQIYSEEYTAAMNEMAEDLKIQLLPRAQDRFLNLKTEAEQAYRDGMAEYENGLLEYKDGAAKAEQELADALKLLQDGQAELETNRQTLVDGEKQIADAQKLLDENAASLSRAQLELANKKAEAYAQIAEANTQLLGNYKLVTESLKQVRDGLGQIEDGLVQINDGIAQIDDAMPQLELVIGIFQLQVNATQRYLDEAAEFGNQELIDYYKKLLAEQTAKLEEYTAQKETAQQTREQLAAQKMELEAQKAELEVNQRTLEESLTAINNGIIELENNKAMTDSQFAAAAAQLEVGQVELENARKELDSKKKEMEDGKAALAEAQEELDKGWEEYESGKVEAETELADAKEQLKEAKAELEEARQTIDEMEEPEVYALTRNTNAGYLALDNNSNIVHGIAKVFPAFFLLVAALVCITTMTRMVEEERTQIGTLKALGYSNWAIMNKYLFYSGSAAVVGCGLGVIAGSVFFPWILWNAYGIIFNITPGIEIVFDWGLNLGITAAYTAVSSLVTWYCCRRTLREVPAELIRPKAPASGKKIFLEYLPFWNKIGFLNKVMLRNVFRYRQRFLMMLVGIGGCTALLLTGFGIRDSVGEIVNIQFEEVTLYDMEVYFSEGQTEEEQQSFREEIGLDAESIGFFYQTSVELEYNDQARDVYLMTSGDDIQDFVDFHRDGEPLNMPGTGEAFLTTGAAEMLGIQLGDTVTVRTSDLQSLTLKVTGIFENHVNNYLVVTPETLSEQWGEAPAYQMAFVNVRDGKDIHSVGAQISAMEDVVNLMICEDQAEMVNSMMDALILVVITVIVCAGMLGAIVLYNLTNINITERIREIATIKVLGFNAKETSAYVFKENILLSVMGAGVGLVGGKFLLDFVMSQIKIDMVWFDTRLTVPSYIYAVLLTIVTALIVDFIFHFRLEKINMAEALKSVE